MSCRDEFRDYDGDFYCPKGWIDASYGNDTCPHIMKRIETETDNIEVRVWQDYVDTDKREDDLGKRYLFQVVCNDYDVFSLESDDWSEMEKLMKGVHIL